ncbi:MAG: hypothetical protein ABL888_14910 [Pirellulaceae bacterium]
MRQNKLTLILGIALVLGARSASADWKDDIGWTRLLTEYGGAPVTGAGVVVSITEAPDTFGNYMPNAPGPLPPEYIGKTFTNASGTSTGQSGHSEAVARAYFGNLTSIAGGTTSITAFEANDWIDNRLNFVSGADPVAHNFKVQNHSWIGNFPSFLDSQNVLQRADFVVDRDEVTMIAGTANVGAIPHMLTHAYNVISVGRTDGGHAKGLTGFYGTGRSRPDIVAPTPDRGPYTSYTTPVVSSVATVLHQAAAGTDAARSESMRAILMAGATKEEFGAWDQTAARRIDDVFGAGEVNVYNSYKIIEAGEFNGSLVEPIASINRYGWDYNSNLNSTDSMFYDIVVGPGVNWTDISILLAWNIEVTDLDSSAGIFNATTSLADFNLELFNSNSSFLGSLLDSSMATVGNVEHLYLNSLGPGRYTLRVTTNSSHDFALAWRANISAIPEPGSFVGLGFLSICLGAFFYRQRPIRRTPRLAIVQR